MLERLLLSRFHVHLNCGYQKLTLFLETSASLRTKQKLAYIGEFVIRICLVPRLVALNCVPNEVHVLGTS